MTPFRCKMCGGTISVCPDGTVGICEYCQTEQTLPKLTTEKKQSLYERAARFRRNNEFDKASAVFEQILEEDETDAESYWSLVLCRYGIEYVEDPRTKKRIPTVNRSQYTSVFDDENYKQAIANADIRQKELYQKEAQAINEIQKGILRISMQEKPFDIFICYKETDEHGRRTPDSVLANELYNALTAEGYSVFFSRITLEDKLGTAYEPYIFAALQSAKIMVVLGTKREYFESAWVKNEWSRYLALIKNGEKKMLIPAFRDMAIEELPEEFSHLQAQDLSKLGYLQDLTRGIGKLLPKQRETTRTQTVSSPLLERVALFLEDGDWESADEYCEKILDQEPKNAHAYLGKVLCESHCKNRSELVASEGSFFENKNFQKALRFADPAFREELEGLHRAQLARIEEEKRRAEEEKRNILSYKKAVELLDKNTAVSLAEAKKVLGSILDYRDAHTLYERCLHQIDVNKDEIYQEAVYLMRSAIKNQDIQQLNEAKTLFSLILSYEDCEYLLASCQKKEEEIKRCAEVRAEAISQSEPIPQSASTEQEPIYDQKKFSLSKCLISIVLLLGIGFGIFGIVWANTHSDSSNKPIYAVATESTPNTSATSNPSGTVSTPSNETSEPPVEPPLVNQVQPTKIAAGGWHTVRLYDDGTVIAVGDNDFGQCNVSEWKDIVAIAAGYDHTVGLKKNGTVVAVGYSGNGQCDVSGWKDIVAIAAGGLHTVGLKRDGTVVAVGDNGYGQKNVSGWKDIVAISAGWFYTVGLKKDGTVVAVGDNGYGQKNVSGWKDIISIAARANHTVGLKKDGTVVAVGKNNDGQCNVSGWRDIVAVAAGYVHTVGLKKDGTVVAIGSNSSGQCNVSDWKNIVAIAAGTAHTVGLKKDGTVVAVGSNDYGQCDVYILNGTEPPFEVDVQPTKIAAGYYHTVRLNDDGTVVAVGDNCPEGQCDVSEWKGIVAIAAGASHTVGLKKDGTVVAVGDNYYGQCDVSGWKDIIAITAGNNQTVGLKKDGTVIAVGDNRYGQCNVSGWEDIVAITAGALHTVGLKKDGTVIAVGNNDDGRCNVSGWKDIVAVAAGGLHTVGLKRDGTVVAVGDNDDGECNVSGWEDIVAITAGALHTVGLKKDGTVVAVGDNYYGQCSVFRWENVMAITAGVIHTVVLKKDGTIDAVGLNDYGQCDVDKLNN